MSSSGDGLLSFVNGDTSGDIPILSVSNPVNWGRLGQTILTSIIATAVAGVTNVVSAVTGAWVSIFGGFEAFLEGSVQTSSGPRVPLDYVPGVIDVVIGGVSTAYGNAFSYSSAQFGILALPVNTAIVLASVYILSVGLQASASRLFGGG